jgi:hypothetical protein
MSGRIRCWVTGRRRRSISAFRLFRWWVRHAAIGSVYCQLACKGQPVDKWTAPAGPAHLSTGPTTTTCRQLGQSSQRPATLIVDLMI